MGYKIKHVAVSRQSVVTVLGSVGGEKREVRKIIPDYDKLTQAEKEREWLDMLGVEKIELDNTVPSKIKRWFR